MHGFYLMPSGYTDVPRYLEDFQEGWESQMFIPMRQSKGKKSKVWYDRHYAVQVSYAIDVSVSTQRDKHTKIKLSANEQEIVVAAARHIASEYREKGGFGMDLPARAIPNEEANDEMEERDCDFHNDNARACKRKRNGLAGGR